MLAAGDALLIPDHEYGGNHWYFIVSDPQADPQRVVLVPVTPWENYKDDSCIIEPSEAPECSFITHQSCIDFRESRLERETVLSAHIKSGVIRHKPGIGVPLLDKIHKGPQETRFLPGKCRLTLEDQNLVQP
jgi:hypothetical protein